MKVYEFSQAPTLYVPLPLGGTLIAGLLGLAVLTMATPARVLETPEPWQGWGVGNPRAGHKI